MLWVRVEHRGQRVDFARPSQASGEQVPALAAVSDWYERGSVAQVAGHERGETPSATVTLDNAGGETAAMLAYPVGARVTIFEDEVEKVRGTCVRYSLGPTVDVVVEI